MVRAFDINLKEHVGVSNPIASGQTLLRASLLPGILKNILDNSRHLSEFRLFEIGREIHARGAELPQETPHFVAARYAREGDGSASLFELKHLAECFMDGCETRLAEPRPFEHPERAAIIAWRGEDVGRLFELHPSLGIKGRAAVLDLDLIQVEKLDVREQHYQPLRRFPVSAFDLSVVAPLRHPADEIRRRLAAVTGNDLVEIEFVREYTGDPIPPDRKSVTYRVTVGAPDRTLSSEEVAEIYQRVVDAMRVP
jgi:phenylalanyl-tRNA synthetase beta chain